MKVHITAPEKNLSREPKCVIEGAWNACINLLTVVDILFSAGPTVNRKCQDIYLLHLPL
jgi:hypothetical protein